MIKLELCGTFHRAVELIGRRWSGAIIFLLLKKSARFAELRAGITGITDRMLSERLHELEAEGIVVRTVIPETPVRVEYSLTDKGHGLAKVMDAITAWAHDWALEPAPHADEVPKESGVATVSPVHT
jgi:DNA-binding HxlR family transcriptional regulator